MAAMLACGDGAYLAGRAPASARGLLTAWSTIDVVTPRRRGVALPGIRAHRVTLRPEERDVCTGGFRSPRWRAPRWTSRRVKASIGSGSCSTARCSAASTTTPRWPSSSARGAAAGEWRPCGGPSRSSGTRASSSLAPGADRPRSHPRGGAARAAGQRLVPDARRPWPRARPLVPGPPPQPRGRRAASPAPASAPERRAARRRSTVLRRNGRPGPNRDRLRPPGPVPPRRPPSARVSMSVDQSDAHRHSAAAGPPARRPDRRSRSSG